MRWKLGQNGRYGDCRVQGSGIKCERRWKLLSDSRFKVRGGD